MHCTTQLAKASSVPLLGHGTGATFNEARRSGNGGERDDRRAMPRTDGCAALYEAPAALAARFSGGQPGKHEASSVRTADSRERMDVPRSYVPPITFTCRCSSVRDFFESATEAGRYLGWLAPNPARFRLSASGPPTVLFLLGTPVSHLSFYQPSQASAARLTCCVGRTNGACATGRGQCRKTGSVGGGYLGARPQLCPEKYRPASKTSGPPPSKHLSCIVVQN